MKRLIILEVVFMSSCYHQAHPGQDAGDAECITDQDCDDYHGCTADWCDLPSSVCAHEVLPVVHVCRPMMGECDTEEVCDGRSPDCPEDVLELPTKECRPAAGPCDEPEYCDGVSPSCPEDVFSSPARECDDGDVCTHDDMCDGAGGCAGINGFGNVEDISTGPGGFFTCALLETGELRCWGNNTYGQLGDGTTEDKAVPAAVLGLPLGDPIVQLAAGGRHVNVLLASGKIMAWGLGETGQLGNGQEGDGYEEHAPVDVKWNPADAAAALGWRQVSGGYLFNCAIQEDDRIFCWGKNDYGQLGNGTLASSSVPVEVTGLAGVSGVIAGNYHACAIDNAGGLMCWGWNSRGQLGNPAAADPSPVPVAVEGLPGRVIDVACGVVHTCAILEDGTIMCWGANDYGQLGSGEGPDSNVPIEVPGLPPMVLDIDSQYEHTCAILDPGIMLCWGHNDRGQLGDGTSGNIRFLPVGVEGLPLAAVSMATGALHTCAIIDDSTVWCWGHNAFGELGIGTPSDEGSPLPLEVLCR